MELLERVLHTLTRHSNLLLGQLAEILNAFLRLVDVLLLAEAHLDPNVLAFHLHFDVQLAARERLDHLLLDAFIVDFDLE